MTIDEAKQTVAQSLSIRNEDSTAWSPPSQSRDAYLDQFRADLTAALVEPELLTLQPDKGAMIFGNWQDRPYSVFIIAKKDDAVLVLNSETRLFSLGHLSATGELSVLGFASQDALSEWID